MNDSTKTKKIKRNVIKNDLWKKFDEEIKNIDDNPIECIYRQSGEREFCDCCKKIPRSFTKPFPPSFY